MRLFIACFALFHSSTGLAHAEDTEGTRRSLKGLTGVRVIVENLDPETEQNGLTKSAIQTDVELKLRLAGIPVLERLIPGSAYLDISVNVLSSSDSSWPYSFEVSIDQNVALVRDPSIALRVTTWSAGAFGIVPKTNVRNLRDPIKDNVDKFINAYLAVNPKK